MFNEIKDAVIIVLVVFVVILGLTTRHYLNAYNTELVKTGLLEASVTKWTGASNLCTNSVTAYEKAMKQADDNYRLAMDKAKITANTHYTNATNILTQHSTGDECVDLKTLILDYSRVRGGKK